MRMGFRTWIAAKGKLERRIKLAIGNAVERRSYVYVYDEKGKLLFSKPTGSGADDGLMGYTGSTVNIRHGSYILTYDERGRQVSSKSAR